MGFYFVMGACYSCQTLISFNPEKVPSIIDERTGLREPVCRPCVERANPIRKANGLQEIVVLDGAYEPASDSPWEPGSPFDLDAPDPWTPL
jgi:hypothetical protein